MPEGCIAVEGRARIGEWVRRGWPRAEATRSSETRQEEEGDETTGGWWWRDFAKWTSTAEVLADSGLSSVHVRINCVHVAGTGMNYLDQGSVASD